MPSDEVSSIQGGHLNLETQLNSVIALSPTQRGAQAQALPYDHKPLTARQEMNKYSTF